MGLVIGLPAFFAYFNINLENTEGNQITGGAYSSFNDAGTLLLTLNSHQWAVFRRRHLGLSLCALASRPPGSTSDHPDCSSSGYYICGIAGRQCTHCSCLSKTPWVPSRLTIFG